MKQLLKFLLAAAACCVAGPAAAFCSFFAPGGPVVVSEHYEPATDRYFLAWSYYVSPGSCVFATATRNPPEGSVPTGLTWSTHRYPEGDLARNVCRFRAAGQQEPRSGFFTINQGACDALDDPASGWIRERDEPRGAEANPSLSAYEVGPGGACNPGTVPVYRFYNGRHAEGLGNHRYVADDATRAAMKARGGGWTEEGIAFCVLSSGKAPILEASQNLAMFYPFGGGAVGCVNGFGAHGNSCIEATNMVMPLTGRGMFRHPSFSPNLGPMPMEFVERTGLASQYAVTYAFATHAEAAMHSFIQLYVDQPAVGLFVSAFDRIAGTVSGMRSWVRTAPVRPYTAAFDADVDVVFTAEVWIRQVAARAAGAEGYAMPMITFRDTTSDKRLSLATGSLGTRAAIDADGRDYLTGHVLVSVALAESTPFGRSPGRPSLQVAAPFLSADPWGSGGEIGYRMNRREFERVIARARAIDPSLSANAEDYEIQGFGVKGEIVGDADLGFSVRRAKLSVLRP
ncbi:MAG TPA: hypothetical protein VEC19_03425 [Usitatibacter sp.]|nr:hypothetical protein [Usitatibacter sp.]